MVFSTTSKVISLSALVLGSLCLSKPAATAQNVGDIIAVKALDFESVTRDTVVAFPDLAGVTYEKIMLKYTMRCKDGLVSTGSERNKGCGEWDYSCNTYLVDSSKIEEAPVTIADNFITNNSEDFFDFVNTPSFDLYRYEQKVALVTSVSGETEARIGAATNTRLSVVPTEKTASKTHYLYTAAELQSAGLSAGEIAAIGLPVLQVGGRAGYLSVGLKSTSATDLSGAVGLVGFEEVYRQTTDFTGNGLNTLQFHTPFVWDGNSNVIVEFNHTNLEFVSDNTTIESSPTTSVLGLETSNEQQLLLSNRAYIEVDGYKGVGGSQNRTVEAWIRTSNGASGEIASWGANVANRKWVFRFANGLLRVENANGGTVSATRVNDGEWHHVAAVLDGDNLSDIRFYVDGQLDGNSSVGNAPMDTDVSASAFNFRVSRGVNNRYLDSEIDDVRIWDTNLSASTIDTWKNLRVDNTHPNFSNLQLYFPFEDNGTTINDASGNGRDGELIGSRYTVSYDDGPTLFKDFARVTERPNLSFFQGTYQLDITTTSVDRPVRRTARHFLTTRTIDTAPAGQLQDDQVIESNSVEVFGIYYDIYNEATGDLISEEELTPDGEIEINDLTYFRRFPFYNELVSFVTPYGIGVDFGLEGKSWYFDMTDYVSILKGNKRLLMTLGGQFQEEMDLEFIYTVGTPPRDVVQYEQLWQGTNRLGHATIGQIASNQKFARTSIDLSAEATSFRIKSSITGHGAEGEFSQNGGVVNHQLALGSAMLSNWQITQECDMNPIYPQGGTWVYDRQGWCPGERSRMQVVDFTENVTPGETVTFDYSTSAPQNPSGDYRYHVAHQVVGYGAANFQQDASLVGVLTPNNTAEFTRTGTICANPQVVIRNTGSTTLESATIKYWINDAQIQQSFEWTGSLEFMEEEVVTIPSPRALWFDITSANNVFYAEVVRPNDGADAYSNNNLVSSGFDFPRVLPRELQLEVRTNSAPTQNVYALYNSAGDVVYTNPLPSANFRYRDDFELGEDCYKLVFRDTGGDGLAWWANPGQGTGSVRLRSGTGSTIKTFEPDFGGGFEYSFSTDFALSAEELSFLASIELYPNPASDYVTLAVENTTGVNVRVVDVLGRNQPVSLLSRSATSFRLDVQSLSKGVYFVVLEKGDMRTTRRLVIDNG